MRALWTPIRRASFSNSHIPFFFRESKIRTMLKASTQVDKTPIAPEHPEPRNPIVDPNVQTATSQDEAELGLNAPEEYEQHCLLFPSYATKQKDDGTTGENWQARIRGWAFQAPKSSRSREVFLDLTSYFTGIHSSTDERWEILKARTQLFWASNFNHGEYTIQVVGVTTSKKMEVEGDPTNKPPTSTLAVAGAAPTPTKSNSFITSASGTITNTISSFWSKPAGEKIGKVVQKIDAKISSHTIKIKPQAGHFQGTIAVTPADFDRWMHEEGFLHSLGHSDTSVRLIKVQAYQSELHPPAYGVVNLVQPEGTSIISVPGMAETYRTLYQRGASIHYVSNGPWQLFPMVRAFFQTYEFPPGSAHMKFYDGLIKSAYQQKENPMASKFFYIRELLKDFPHRKFILIGDTGELDPEIWQTNKYNSTHPINMLILPLFPITSYTTIAREHPDQIIRIFIRDVTTARVKDLPAEEPHASYIKTFPVLISHIYGYYSGPAESATTAPKTPAELKSQMKENEAIAVLVNKQQQMDQHLDAEIPPTPTPEEKRSIVSAVYNDLVQLYSTATPTAQPHNCVRAPTIVAHSAEAQKSEDHTVELKTPLHMFQERIDKLTEGLPGGLFSLFTDAKQILDDNTVKKAFKSNSWW
ncbi:hypothetical protein BC936DRAFT_140039 [Jimgerdemannia flammicorona]|uniref:Phosphatidate phosphatase APP1 catalytic domain-containing protein n=1 Tax=Jimgerdemannia flammicorona TaxID=994334 RepID=A0A433DHC2_9FUNG|nr:hypothetical protein BC936DRAFT_140039 [Jimgerdemannia flammicorona]